MHLYIWHKIATHFQYCVANWWNWVAFCYATPAISNPANNNNVYHCTDKMAQVCGHRLTFKSTRGNQKKRLHLFEQNFHSNVIAFTVNRTHRFVKILLCTSHVFNTWVFLFIFPLITGSKWSLLGWSVWGHQLVRHPRQACNHHAQGYPAGTSYPWRACINATCQYYLRPKCHFPEYHHGITLTSVFRISLYFLVSVLNEIFCSYCDW